jgi:hypothetical protein
MPSVRQALAKHLEAVATFSLKALGIDSGIYDGSQLSAILKESDTIIRLEQAWIGDLLETMRIMQRAPLLKKALFPEAESLSCVVRRLWIS